ncbi:hypothetical protein [Acaryochloris sp. CCMEE 5410]|uniref:hypothetical protein n=1 Tax=Acaryochloris sp. CCMEE 5410 TaxID=310037 RepID=UPI0002483C73|nr:hypothetical protein [Acaryochloris sp. CCMEE 5410]KAI9130678.1 hypothetical protein ON05_023210 [Acaryochloris sp. CCMEE 5410]
MQPITTVEAVLQKIDTFSGEAAEFQLPISESLMDKIGINMAIITDRILAKGWTPNGFQQEEGYRVYSYRDLNGFGC